MRPWLDSFDAHPDVPHATTVVRDSCRPKGGALLRSELRAAVGLIMSQRREDKFPDHIVFPVWGNISFSLLSGHVLTIAASGPRHQHPRALIRPYRAGLPCSSRAGGGQSRNRCTQAQLSSAPLTGSSSAKPLLAATCVVTWYDPDAEDVYGFTTLGNLDMRVQNPSLWCSVPMRWLAKMVALIVATREANWEAGLFLETRESRRADGQHALLVQQLARLRQRIERDPSFGDLEYAEVDVEDRYIGFKDEDETGDDQASSRSELEDGEYDKQDLVGSDDDEGDVFHDALEGSGR